MHMLANMLQQGLELFLGQYSFREQLPGLYVKPTEAGAIQVCLSLANLAEGVVAEWFGGVRHDTTEQLIAGHSGNLRVNHVARSATLILPVHSIDLGPSSRTFIQTREDADLYLDQLYDRLELGVLNTLDAWSHTPTLEEEMNGRKPVTNPYLWALRGTALASHCAPEKLTTVVAQYSGLLERLPQTASRTQSYREFVHLLHPHARQL